jgi:hypothetical protein
MSHFRPYDTIRSPEDAATFRQWRRAVCLFYAAIILILVAVAGAWQSATSGRIEVAGSPASAAGSAPAASP